jgi:hypothetical protein
MNGQPNGTDQAETPTPPPSAETPPPLPAPTSPKITSGSGDPCTSLTSDAIQAVIDQVKDSLTKAKSDDTAHGPGAPIPGAYASAARDNVTYLTEARDKMETLLAWLYTVGALGSPSPTPPTYVSNTSAAYNIHGYVRETIISLHYARHWALISATHHQSAPARASYESTTEALDLIEPLGAQAGRCHMEAYGPFS